LSDEGALADCQQVGYEYEPRNETQDRVFGFDIREDGMIEILKELAQIFKELPEAAIYVAGGILFYKLTIVGSAYGLARFAISAVRECILDWRRKPTDLRLSLDGLCIRDSKENMIEFIKSLRNDCGESRLSHNYVHGSDILRAKELIEKGKLYEKQGKAV
jgi:hypothetical protein